jgi:8-oxo-dGTP pyrophosphatase MutT (NUDIX family)
MEERSAGAIVFHDDGAERKYLLLKYPAGHWDFPKGNVEKGESEVQTATREVREETGLENLSFVTGFRKQIEYFYRRGGKRVHKQVVFLLAATNTETVRLSHEHHDFGWFAFKEALSRVTYPNSKNALTLAEELLRGAKRKPGEGSSSSLESFFQDR